MDDIQNRQTVLFSATQTPEVGISIIRLIQTLCLYFVYRFLCLYIDLSCRLKSLLSYHLKKMKKVKENQFMLELMMTIQR
jgi:hypothetical protein